jgi:hypothetical protein
MALLHGMVDIFPHLDNKTVAATRKGRGFHTAPLFFCVTIEVTQKLAVSSPLEKRGFHNRGD